MPTLRLRSSRLAAGSLILLALATGPLSGARRIGNKAGVPNDVAPPRVATFTLDSVSAEAVRWATHELAAASCASDAHVPLKEFVAERIPAWPVRDSDLVADSTDITSDGVYTLRQI